LGLLILAWYLRHLLLLLFGSVLVSVILRLIAHPIHRNFRVTSGVALGLAVLLLLAGVSVAFWLFGAEIARQTEALQVTLPNAWQSFQARLEAGGWGEWLQRGLDSFRTGAPASFGRFALTVTNGIGDTLLVIVGGIYLAARPELYRTGLIKLIPAEHRPLTAAAIEDAGTALKLWLRGRLVSMTVVGVLTAVGLYLIGVPSWLSLGLLSGLLEFIPFIGPIISAVPAVLLALAHSPQAAYWTVGLYFLVQQLEGNVIEPLVQQRAVSIPPALLLFALVAAALMFGIGGILLGAPLTVVIYVLIKRLYVQEVLDTPTPMPTEHPPPGQ
jgi:predicted PurR-regulated permease PerM